MSIISKLLLAKRCWTFVSIACGETGTIGRSIFKRIIDDLDLKHVECMPHFSPVVACFDIA